MKEGGYSADEPELYASFRHFYDPIAEEQRRPAYLTDHIEELNSYFQVFAGGMTINFVNPKVDARDWAINGTNHEGLGENEYSWNQGVKYIQKAFSSQNPVEKSKLFAQGWRALGETMHLLADMTVPAHVRNDSHPALATPFVNPASTQPLVGIGDPNTGFLKGDPYEIFAQQGMISNAGKVALETELRDYLADPLGNTPEKLFDRRRSDCGHAFHRADQQRRPSIPLGRTVHAPGGGQLRSGGCGRLFYWRGHPFEQHAAVAPG